MFWPNHSRYNFDMLFDVVRISLFDVVIISKPIDLMTIAYYFSIYLAPQMSRRKCCPPQKSRRIC